MRAYRVAYDGRAYYGFQRQPGVSTVEDTLFSGLADLGIEFDDTPVGYTVAGRTDRGVSALAQTVAFDAPEWLSPRAFTTQLPSTIHVWASAAAPEDFHAIHDAISREYTYYLHAPDADSERLRAIEKRLSGKHDFHNLAAENGGTVRDLTVTSTRAGPFRLIRVRAGGFPRQLVRRLVSLYDRMLQGAAPLDFIDRVLGPKPLSGPDGIEPAPAHPLVLTDVDYDLDFDPDPKAAELAREAFASGALRDRTRAAVLDSLETGIPDPVRVDDPGIGDTGDNP